MIRLPLFVGLVMGDVITTTYGLGHGTSEVNPISGQLLSIAPALYALVKFAAAGLLLAAWVFAPRLRHLTEGATLILIGAVGWAVTENLMVIYR